MSQRFREIQQIGDGSFCTTFKAFDVELGSYVLLKKPKESVSLLGFDMERELTNLRHVKHVSIMSCYGLASFEEQMCLIGEWIPGPTLAQWLNEPEQPNEAQTKSVVVCLLDALVACQRVRLRHRDISPNNIVLRGIKPNLEKIQAVLVDFGISTIAHSKREGRTESGMPFGTAGYAAPEAMDIEKDPDRRADIYSVAAIAYRMLEGTTASHGGNSTLKCNDKDLERFINLSLKYEPLDRPQSAQVALDELLGTTSTVSQTKRLIVMATWCVSLLLVWYLSGIIKHPNTGSSTTSALLTKPPMVASQASLVQNRAKAIALEISTTNRKIRTKRPKWKTKRTKAVPKAKPVQKPTKKKELEFCEPKRKETSVVDGVPYYDGTVF